MNEILLQWVEYYYKTEEYDRSLPHVPFQGSAIVRPDFRHISEQYARSLRFRLEAETPSRYVSPEERQYWKQEAQQFSHEQCKEIYEQFIKRKGRENGEITRPSSRGNFEA